MSGLVKAKKYDWKDTNLAMFGSDTEKQVKKESAETEPAWTGCGKEVGIQIWRINKFKVDHLPKEDYGEFYNGDSYIILNTYKEEDGKELKYDLHFWIGKESTQDEYGTAAYKTVELDTFLNDAAVQHREVGGYESALFKTYFRNITYKRGGHNSGFRHVKPEEYKPRLFHVSGKKKQVKVDQVSLCPKSVNSGDVFILDLGKVVYLWTGKDCNKDERFKATQYIQSLRAERCGKATVEYFDERDEDDKFSDYIKEHAEEDDDDDDDEDTDKTSKLFRLSDEGGELKQTLEKEGNKFQKSLLDSKDVFILDTTKEVIVWCGKRCSNKEKKNGFSYAHNYLKTTAHPKVPVSVIKEGQRYHSFDIALVA